MHTFVSSLTVFMLQSILMTDIAAKLGMYFLRVRAVFLKNNNFWDKVNNCSAVLEDIENHIYSLEYLNTQSATEYSEVKNVYNTDLVKYFFEVEEYQNEEDYEEIFFQGFLDGDIDEKEYYNAENSFINLINILSDTGNVYIYFDFSAPVENNFPLRKSTDVNFDIDFLNESQDKFIKISDCSQLRQISILLAREIVSGFIIFDGIKSVLECSGMHGYIISDNILNSDLLNRISLYTRIIKDVG